MADDHAASRLSGRFVLWLALVAGVVATAIASLGRLAEDLFRFVATPPPVIRAGFAGAAIFLGAWLLLGAIRRIDSSIRRDPKTDGGRISDADLGSLVRGVRLVFLSVASFTAAAGWLIGDPLPLVIALVIAGVDVIETSFLLLVATRRSR
jgi:hypothetical protein